LLGCLAHPALQESLDQDVASAIASGEDV